MRTQAITTLTQNSHLKKIKYEATADPKCDSMALIFCSQGMNQFETLAASLLNRCHCCKTSTFPTAPSSSARQYLGQIDVPPGQHILRGPALGQPLLQHPLVLLDVRLRLLDQPDLLPRVPRLHLDAAQHLLVQPDVLEDLLLGDLGGGVLVDGDRGAGTRRFWRAGRSVRRFYSPELVV